ncbi:MAG: DUF86 domain-containing protein [Candidatus Aenigmarchaeota archaeon]|nr:DUF86 domain-containing protein [Candidatus Aenigmarchaeota archaeon]
MDEKEKISRKMRAMKKYVDFLKSYKGVSEKDLKYEYTLKCAIERNFQLALEAVLEIGEIIISVENFERPEDYKSIILILGKNKIIPAEFAKRFAPSAGFRNILVHMYEEVDIKKLIKHLKKLNDFDLFAKYIAQYLKMKYK